MKLKVIVDNNTYIDQYYYGEPAVCYYIEDNGTKLLLDVGYSNLCMKNARELGVDLASISTIVISHGHNDHTGGLRYLQDEYDLSQVTLVAHPDACKEKWEDGLEIGSPWNEEQLRAIGKLTLTKVPVKISENIIFLGQIPQLNDFEERKVIGSQKDEGGVREDYVYDDSALVYRGRDGLFIVTGCSHSGICNIIEYAKQVCKEDRVLGILGGLHLFEVSTQLEQTIAYLVKNNIKELYPCHCVSFQAKAEINKVIPIHEVGVGLEIEIIGS